MIKTAVRIIVYIIIIIPTCVKAQIISNEVYLKAPTAMDVLSFEVADLNHDGYEDVIIYGYGNYGLYYKLNLGNDSFSKNIPLPVESDYVYKVLSCDFNNDEYLDLLILESDDFSSFNPPFFSTINHRIKVLINSGQNTFNQTIDLLEYTGFPDRNIYIFDYNFDGFDDIIYNNKLYTNSGENHIQSPFELPGELSWNGKNEFLDINNDGFLDLVRTNPDTISIFRGNIGGFDAERFVIDLNPNDYLSSFGYVNNDSLIDLVVYNSQSNGFLNHQNLGNFNYSTPIELDISINFIPNGFDLPDLNNDGLSDLFIDNSSFSSLNYSINNLDGWSDVEPINTDSLRISDVFENYCLIDFNQDGFQDLIFNLRRNTLNTGVFIKSNILNSDSGITPLDFSFEAIDLVNLDGDNNKDVVLGSHFIGAGASKGFTNYYTLLNDESIELSEIATSISEYTVTSKRIFFDLNNDSFSDAIDVSFNQEGIRFETYINDSNGSFNNTNPDFIVYNFDSPLIDNIFEPIIPIVYVNTDLENDACILVVHCSNYNNNEAERIVLFRYTVAAGFEKISDWLIPYNNRFNLMPTKSLEIDDFDFDGDYDLIIKDRIKQNIRIINNIDSSHYEESVSIEMELIGTDSYSWIPNICKLKDLNGDGLKDIITNHYNPNTNVSKLYAIPRGQENQYLPPIQIHEFNSGIRVSDLILNDFNSDLAIDILVKSWSGAGINNNGALSILNNLGDFLFNYNLAYSIDSDGQYDNLGSLNQYPNERLFLEDFNNDGIYDIIFSDGNKVSLFYVESLITEFKNHTYQSNRLYPNPTKNVVYFENKFTQNSRYILHNSLGQKLRSGLLVNSQSLDISDLKNGIYSLTIKTDLGTSNYKIIKN